MPLSTHSHSAGVKEEILCCTFSLSNLSMYQVFILAGRHTDHPLPLSVLLPGPPWAAEANSPLRGEAALGLPPRLRENPPSEDESGNMFSNRFIRVFFLKPHLGFHSSPCFLNVNSWIYNLVITVESKRLTQDMNWVQ